MVGMKQNKINEAIWVCVSDRSGKPTATRNEWRGLVADSPTPKGHALLIIMHTPFI